MHYYQRGPRIEATELDATASRLERDGWQRITPVANGARRGACATWRICNASPWRIG